MEAASIQGPAGGGARRVEAMVTRHGPALLRVANQFSLCHDDALDAYQRALEIYLRRMESVDLGTEGAWMRVVVKHEAMARPVPVLPDVGSMIVPPARSRPSRSAASMSFIATRSLIDPPGLNDSTLATICGASPAPIRLSRTSGVSPTVSRIESLMSCVVPVAAGGVMEATIGG